MTRTHLLNPHQDLSFCGFRPLGGVQDSAESLFCAISGYIVELEFFELFKLNCFYEIINNMTYT